MANPTIGATTPRIQYTATASQTVFTVPFEFLANADLAVYVNGTLKTLTTDYTLTGANTTGGGTLTFVTGRTAGDIVTILSNLAYSRDTNKYTRYGLLPAEVLEADFDAMQVQAKQLARDGQFALRAPLTDTGSPSMTLPVVATRASKLLGFDSDGDPVTSSSTVAAMDAAVTAINTIAGASSGSSAGISHIASGTGAVTTTVQAKLREIISVTDFGASTSASAATNSAAFNAAVTAAGVGAVYVPAGSYAISGTVTGTFFSFGQVTITGGTVNYIAPSAISGAAIVGSESYRFGIKFGSMDSTVLGSYMFDGRSSFPNKLGVNNTKPVTDPSTGARTADSAYVAGTAEVSAILAGYDNVNNALAGMIASQHSMLYTGADHASIWGGSLNTINDDTDYSTIVGGTNNTIEGRGRYAAIISGDQNKIETGASDDLSGFRSIIASSSICTASGRNAVILGSSGSRIDSTYGTILGGETVTLTNGTHMGAGGNTITMGGTASAAYSFSWGLSHTIDGARAMVFGEGHVIGSGHDYASARGYRTVTPFIGSHTFSARHRGGTVGRNQAVDFTCSQETTDTTTTRLSVAGSTNYPTQPTESIVNGTAWVTGVNTATGACSTFRIDFTSERVGTGTPTLRANTTTTVYNGLALGTVPTMNATTGGIYRVQVVGLAATNIAWDARIAVQQVVYTP